MPKISYLGPNFSIASRLKSAPKINGVLFRRMKEKVLGKNYELSLVFIGIAYSQKLNKRYRHKDKPADILSFGLEKKSGEIFISPKAKEADLPYLFIHGLCHLKGFTHGSKMESEEKKYRKFFGIPSN